MVTLGVGSSESETVAVIDAAAKLNCIAFTPSLKFAHEFRHSGRREARGGQHSRGRTSNGCADGPAIFSVSPSECSWNKATAEVLDVNITNILANDVVTPTEADVVTPVEADVITPMEVVDTPAQVVDVESSSKLGYTEPNDSARTGNAESTKQNGGHATKSAAYAAMDAKSNVPLATVASIVISAVGFVALFGNSGSQETLPSKKRRHLRPC
jgi:hypothetical protein